MGQTAQIELFKIHRQHPRMDSRPGPGGLLYLAYDHIPEMLPPTPSPGIR
jgi:hypothetical protein